MVNPRALMLTGATLCGAVAIGVAMQPQLLSNAKSLVFGAAQDAVQETVDAQDSQAAVLPNDPDVPLILENITLTAAHPTLPETAASDRSPVSECGLSLGAVLHAAAMVSLSVETACTPYSVVKIHHNGMIFATSVDGAGQAEVLLPALNETSVFIAETESGYHGTVSMTVPEVANYDRVVLQWGGYGGFELHAREFGANYGEEGHVWTGAAQGGVGTVYRLGDVDAISPLLADVYSLPRDADGANGRVELTVEAEVSELNCNQTVAAQTLDLRQGTLRGRDLVLNMPTCDAIGDFLVLNNLVENLTIAAN
ncbi:hypothetical protein KMP13_06490 [Epibacterium ulvae]|uniref:hypothetical protein n=1 Tax=Epibacterium ulvae TaxID=1156985 RepID=UPI001BFCCA8D|nr:hypothetical protein [Epibacterium ulvae]MBT8153549.1 hypothetical protein [Epibacterium ulvae]